MGRSSRSKALQEVVGSSSWPACALHGVLFTFFPEGGLTSVTGTAIRAAAALGVVGIGTALGWVLWAADLIPWSPGVRSYALWRQRQAQQRRELEERRVEAQQAVWRAVESLPDPRPQDSDSAKDSEDFEPLSRQSA